MNFRRLSVCLFSALLLVSCGNKQGEKEQAAPQKYETTVVQAQKAHLETVYPVTIKGQEDIEIRPRVDGFIENIYVDEGSIVRKGQRLFSINSPMSKQGVDVGIASVNSAQAQVNTAKLNVDRIRPLAEKGIISNVQLETAENSYQTALASLAQARAQLANARSTASWATVTSPVDGVVGTISFRQGSLVNSANILTTVANTSNVFAYFSLNEKELIEFLKNAEGKTQAEKIRNMSAVKLILADGSEYEEKGKIETISGVVNVTTGSVNFRAEFPNKQGLLRSGTSGKISIPRDIDNVFVIPQKATFSQQDKVLVYKVQADTVAQSVITVVSMPDGKSYAVTGGLKDGERIVTDGLVTLSTGKKITF